MLGGLHHFHIFLVQEKISGIYTEQEQDEISKL